MQSQLKRWVQPEMDATSDILAGLSRQMAQTKSAGGGESGSSPAVLPPTAAEAAGFPSSSTSGSDLFDRLVEGLNGVKGLPLPPPPAPLTAAAGPLPRADLRDCCTPRLMATAASRAARRVDLLVVWAGLRTTSGDGGRSAIVLSSSRAWRWSAAALALRVTRADM